ncbi:hypothetical protein ACFY3U_03915 [Micromonospora sp. NPDC000089]|uniref:hypothetical protein n=1 Tax=unclassified Micromonospora TaxID=2617518 RepID=UPI00368EDCB1
MTALSIIALFGIVVLSVHVVGQVAPSAIAAISSISLAAITALGVVLRRRPPGRGGS